MVSKTWSFEWLQKQCRGKGILAPQSSEDWLPSFWHYLRDESQPPHGFSGMLSTNYGGTILPLAVQVAQNDRKEALERVHLHVRVEAFAWTVYLRRLEDLVLMELERQKTEKRFRAPIGRLTWTDMTDLSMLTASAFVVGILDAADWLAEQVIRYKDVDSAATNFEEQPLVFEWFMVELICKFKRMESSRISPPIGTTDIFHRILANWESNIDSELLELSDLHARKLLSIRKSNDDLITGLNYGINRFLPIELMFIGKVREQQGLSFKVPDHELFINPLISFDNYPESGFDAVLQIAADRCNLPEYKIVMPWEERFQLIPARSWQRVVEQSVRQKTE